MAEPNPAPRRYVLGPSVHALRGTHLDIELPREVVSSLNDLLIHSGDSIPDLFRKALALYKVGVEAKEEDNRLAVVGPDGEIVQEIVGL